MVNTYKVVLCGKTGVGKTCIFKRICGKKYNPKENPGKTRKEHECLVTVKVDDVEVQLNVLDTLGLEQYAQLTRSYFLHSHAVLIVYSGDDKDSLEPAFSSLNCAKNDVAAACFILIRNKIDLESKVTEDDVRNWFSDKNFTLQFRTSAKTGEGIQDMVQNLAAHLRKQATPKRPCGHVSPQQVDLALDSGACCTEEEEKPAQTATNGLVSFKIGEAENQPPRRRRKCCSIQ